MREHRGITYGVPKSDDGQWRWIIYPSKDTKGFARVNAAPRRVYPSHAAAAKAAVRLIDAVLDGKPSGLRA